MNLHGLPQDPSPDEMTAPAGVYLHIPFCRSKCGYCAFNSIPCLKPPASYLTALKQEMAAMASQPTVQELSFGSLFLGGGTPTIYEPALLADLIRTTRQRFRFEPQPEITVEANPNTVTPEMLRLLREAGVNRLSLGVQSFSDRLLRACDRTHSSRQAVQAFRWARQAGFTNCSLDLIYGLPGQSQQDWRDSLTTALALAPEHFSLYELSVEENTPFALRQQQGVLALPPEDTVFEMAEQAYAALAAAGYQRYEISNFARPGRECRHNLIYWHNRPYLGLGAGAVSFLASIRIRNVADLELYCRLTNEGRPPYQEAECLPATALFRETVIMGLRLLDGISLTELRQRFGTTPREVYGPVLDRLLDRRLLAITADRLRLTTRALPLANQVLSELV